MPISSDNQKIGPLLRPKQEAQVLRLSSPDATLIAIRVVKM